jgi:PAS domain S-box-containing protein
MKKAEGNIREILAAKTSMGYPESGESGRLQAYLQSIIESMPGAIIALDTTGQMTYLNSTALQYFPELAIRKIGATLWHTVPFLAKYHKAFLTVLQDNKPVEFQKENFNKQMMRITLFPLMTGAVNGVVLKVNDITEQEKLQQRLIQAQKMEAIETLVSGLAHDFNNILSGMMMTLDYLKQYVLTPEETFTRADIDEELIVLSTSIERASNLVQQLLTISMRKEISVQSVDINEAVGHVVKICRRSFDKSIEFSLDIHERPTSILADLAQLEQVILNTCINASHAMTIMRSSGEAWGGTLKISVKPISLDKPVENGFSEAIPGEYWCLCVEDTGVGMDEETMKKIFEPFFTTKETGKGSGLGLAMVYSIVKRFSGQINVYSEPGKGSAFHIYFPIDKPKDIIS